MMKLENSVVCVCSEPKDTNQDVLITNYVDVVDVKETQDSLDSTSPSTTNYYVDLPPKVSKKELNLLDLDL